MFLLSSLGTTVLLTLSVPQLHDFTETSVAFYVALDGFAFFVTCSNCSNCSNCSKLAERLRPFSGYLVNDCFAEQQSLRSGDIIVAIERRLLVDLSEDEVEENFGAEFCDGASLVVGTFEELQHFSLQSISRRASDIVMSEAPEGVGAVGAVQGDRRELTGEQQHIKVKAMIF